MERNRIHAEGSVYFVTFTVVEWLPVFISEPACRIITDSLNSCHRTKGLNAYIIMPTHFQGVFFHESFDGKVLESVLTDMRKFTGRQLADFCQRHMPACFGQVLRPAAGDDRKRRFWLSHLIGEGAGAERTATARPTSRDVFWRAASGGSLCPMAPNLQINCGPLGCLP